MQLYTLLEDNAKTSLENLEITGLTDDSRKVQSGMVFACIRGERFDGHTAAAEALEKGAAAVLVDHDLGLGDRQILTEDTRALYGKLCAAWFGHPERKMRFIGVTGTNGKTTITNLLNRFYDIDSGSITIDGVNVRDIKRDVLRKNIAMVLQDTHLFTGTIRENIRYGRPDATDDEVIAAAKTASAHSFIMRLEHGYDTVITGDGANLSQGQRQLLAIARAAVADPPVLILDEATSSIDTRTEALVQRGMDGLMYGRTSFVIAHRLSTVRNADCIVVLEQGRIIERGNHAKLIAEKGVYYQLYTGAFELE